MNQYNIRVVNTTKLVLAMVLTPLTIVPVFVFGAIYGPPLPDVLLITAIFLLLGIAILLTLWVVKKIMPKALLTLNDNGFSVNFQEKSFFTPNSFEIRIGEVTNFYTEGANGLYYLSFRTSVEPFIFNIEAISKKDEDIASFYELMEAITKLVDKNNEVHGTGEQAIAMVTLYERPWAKFLVVIFILVFIGVMLMALFMPGSDNMPWWRIGALIAFGVPFLVSQLQKKEMKRILVAICLLVSIAAGAFAQQPVLQEGLALKYLVQLPAAGQQHAPVIILLHGYGSDEKDLFELKTAFPRKYLVISARAPYQLPGGGYEWYESITVDNGRHDGNKEQLDNSRNSIIKFIGQVVEKYQADAGRVYVMGFSQGAIISYEAGLTAPDKIKGIGVLSGVIYPSLKPLIKDTPALRKLKIFIAHGTADNRIPFAGGKASYDYLKNLGLSPDFHEYAGMGHTISNEVLMDVLRWLQKQD